MGNPSLEADEGKNGERMMARGGITASSSSLNKIREMNLINNAALDDDDDDHDDDDTNGERGGTTTIRGMFRGLQYLVLDEADKC